MRLSHLGDVVQALGLWHALRTAWPAARFAWAVETEFADLLEGLEGLETVRFERRAGARAWPRLARDLARCAGPDGFDLAIDAQGNAKSAAVLLTSRARRRVGSALADRRERIGWLASTECAPPVGRGAHALERVRTLAAYLAPSAATALWRTDAALRDDERQRGRARSDQLAGPGRAAVVVHLGASDDPRSWPAARISAFARVAAARGHAVVIVSGPGEAETGAALARELAPLDAVTHWIGQRGLREFAALLAAQAERGGRFVGGDSGPVHLAAAEGLPCVLLAGPQDPARTGPWPSAHHAAVLARTPLPCRPCLARRCALPDGPRCTAELDEADVLAALPPPAALQPDYSSSRRTSR